MADIQASIAFVAQDQTSGACSSATSALDRMKQAVKSDVQELAALNAAMRNLKGPGAESSDQFRSLSEQATAMKARIQSNTEEFLKAGGSAKDLATKTAGAAESTAVMSETTKKALGPYGELVERGNALWQTLGAGGMAAGGVAVALVALAAVVVAAGVALAQLVAQMAQFALESSDAAIKSQALLVGLTGSAGAAAQLGGAVGNVAGKVPLAADQVQKLAEGLWKAGKRGSELESALLDASLASAGMKGAGPEALAARMANLDVQTMKFKEHLADVFSGPRTMESVSRFELGLKSVMDLFDTSTESGRALQSMVGVMMAPLFDGLSAAAPYAKRFFQGMVIGALILTVGILKLRTAFDEAIGGIDVGPIDWMTVAMWAGVVVVGVIVVLLGLLAIAAVIVGLAIMAIVASAALFVGMFIAIPALILGVAVALMVAIPAAIAYAIDALADLGSTGLEAAGNLIQGLVDGITSGAGAVFDALRNMASSMGATIESALSIGSPSKLFRQYGKWTSAGMAEGVEEGTPGVASAVQSMVAPPELARPESGAGGKGSTHQITVRLEGGSASEQKQARSLVTQLSEALETACAEAGVNLAVVVA